MAEQLDGGHTLTEEDVDAASLIKSLNDALGRPTDALTLRIANTPLERVARVNGVHVDQEADLVHQLTERVSKLERLIAAPERLQE